MKNRKLILYIACSLDGYIAKPHDDLSFLNVVQKDGEDYGYNEFISSVDTAIIGRKTYDWVMTQVKEFPYSEKEIYIITRTKRPKEGNLTFYSGDLKKLVTNLKNKTGRNIFCDGGAEIVNELLKAKLFDELIISIIPTLVGEGIKLFKDDRPEQGLKLLSVKEFDIGLVQLHYKIITKTI